MHSLFQSNLRAVEFVPLLLTIAIFIFTAFGWYFGKFRIRKYSGGEVIVRDSLVAAIFGLSALVLGFTFSGSASRYFDRMDGIRLEAQSLKQVYESIKYLAPSDQAKIKTLLNELLDLRLSAYKHIQSMSDVDNEANKIMASTREIEEEVRRASVNTPFENKGLVNDLLIPQVGNLSSASAAGIIKSKSHPPRLLMKFLFTMLCIGAFLIGYTMAVKKEHDWLLATLYILLIGISLYVILSLEVPNLLMSYDEINRDFLVLKEAIK